MIKNSLLIYTDENDPSLKNYFKKCACKISSIFEYHADVNLVIEEGNQLYENPIKLSECVFNEYSSPIFLVILSHGNENGFHRYSSSNTPFLSVSSAIPSCLNEGVLYSVACSTGKNFGVWLGKNNGSFFGYSQPINVVKGQEDTYSYLDALGTHYILSGQTLEEVKSSMKKAYNSKIDNTFGSALFLAASLREARDSICIHGKINHRFF